MYRKLSSVEISRSFWELRELLHKIYNVKKIRGFETGWKFRSVLASLWATKHWYTVSKTIMWHDKSSKCIENWDFIKILKKLEFFWFFLRKCPKVFQNFFKELMIIFLDIKNFLFAFHWSFLNISDPTLSRWFSNSKGALVFGQIIRVFPKKKVYCTEVLKI